MLDFFLFCLIILLIPAVILVLIMLGTFAMAILQHLFSKDDKGQF